jgi:drug/metabolite transporter (DMT)-like permease
MMNGLLFILPLYRYNFPNMIYSPWQYESVRNYMPLFVAAAVTTVLPLVAIFFFKDRKRQRGMVWLSIISISSFIAIMLMRVSNLRNGSPSIAHFEYVLPGVLVVLAAMVFLVLALQGIRKDEKLIKSLDRLR